MGFLLDRRGPGTRAGLHAAWAARAVPMQAAIQALHCAARRYEATDWAAIVRFYGRLLAVMPTPE